MTRPLVPTRSTGRARSREARSTTSPACGTWKAASNGPERRATHNEEDTMAVVTEPSRASQTSARPGLFSFPDPVNEVSARLVAGAVVIMSLATIVLDQPLLIVVIAYGFVARVLTGPTLSPLGQLVTRVVTPRLGLPPKYVSG